MVDDARQRTMQWLEAAPSVLDILSGLLDEHGQLRQDMEAAERECTTLRQELAAMRAENDRLIEAGREIDHLIVDGLGKAHDALLRFRAPLAPPAAVAPLGAAEISPGASAAQEPGPPSARRILLVDDDASFRSMIVDYLARHSEYEVLAAANGEEALALLPRFQPRVVLLDLAMPGGGTWAIERIKALHPALCVIVVTANDDVRLARRARALGASDYLMKPFDLADLGAVLDIHMPGHDAAPAPRSPVPAASDGADEEGTGLTSVRSIESCFSRREKHTAQEVA
jgi:CheY-like chemotaxis protein